MNELNEAQMRVELRTLYRDLGVFYSLRVVYEMILTASLLLEIIHEEKTKKGLES